MHRNALRIVFILFSVIGYGLFVFASSTPSPGGFIPGAELDPLCDPGTSVANSDPYDCFVKQAWTQNVTDGFVYNVDDNIGIGTDTPTARLDIVGDIDATATEIANANNGTQNIFDFAATLNPALDITETNYRGLSSTLNLTGAFNYDGLTIDPMSIAAITGVANSTNIGNTDYLTGGLFRALNMSTGNIGILSGASTQAFNLSTGEIDQILGTSTSAGNYGTGAVSQIVGASVNAHNYAAGSVGDLAGMRGSANNVGSGTVNFGYGATTEIQNSGSGIVQYAFGVDNKVLSKGTGSITEAIGHKYSIYATTGSIGSAVGMTFASGYYGSDGDQPGLEATGNVTGIQFLDNGNGLGSLNSTGGGTVTAISINDGALVSNGGNVYGIYIADGNGENYFGNGLRIGTDDEGNKIYSASTGSTSNTLYIGNATIDVTTPSDERTKKDIADTSFGIDDLNNIRVVDFMYNQDIINDGEKPHTGVLAQQVQSIYPEAVTKRSDGYFMVDYKAFIPLLMKSVQDLDLKLTQIDASAATVSTSTTSFFIKVRTWLADATNGITKIFAGEIQTKKLCVADDGGATTCITKSQLDELLGDRSVTAPSPSPSPSPAPTPDPTPAPVPESVPETAPEPEVIPEPEPEPVPEPEVVAPDPVPEPVV